MTVANPNLFLFNHQHVLAQLAPSPRFAMYNLTGVDTVTQAGQSVIANDLTQMKTATLKQITFRVGISLNVYFVVNGLDYFTHFHTSGDETIHNFDLTTLVGNFGSPPLIMNKGETVGWRIDPVGAVTSKLGFVCAVWADILGYGS